MPEEVLKKIPKPNIPVEKMTKLHLPTTLYLEAKVTLMKHGCSVTEGEDGCILEFPEGTTREMSYRANISDVLIITFPDGYELQEIYDRCQNRSALHYTKE
jgi:hypothetical protein